MSVLIRGMEMPTSCRYCAFFHMSLTESTFCTAAHETINYLDKRTKRLDNCPLVHVPPHGRLIDADALEPDTDWFYGNDGFTAFSKLAIESAPTIIEGDEE